MSASGSGRYALSVEQAGEPLPNPAEAAWVEFAEALGGVEAEKLMRRLDRAGLTICWKAPSDG